VYMAGFQDIAMSSSPQGGVVFSMHNAGAHHYASTSVKFSSVPILLFRREASIC